MTSAMTKRILLGRCRLVRVKPSLLRSCLGGKNSKRRNCALAQTKQPLLNSLEFGFAKFCQSRISRKCLIKSINPVSALLCSRHLGNLGCPCLKIFKHNLVRAGADPSHLALVAARSGSGSGPVWSKHKFIESGFVPSRVRFASLASRSGSVGFRLRRETHRGCDNFCAPQQTIRRHIYMCVRSMYIYI